MLVRDYGGRVDGFQVRPRGLRGCLWVRLPDGTWKRHLRWRFVTERVKG